MLNADCDVLASSIKLRWSWYSSTRHSRRRLSSWRNLTRLRAHLARWSLSTTSSCWTPARLSLTLKPTHMIFFSHFLKLEVVMQTTGDCEVMHFNSSTSAFSPVLFCYSMFYHLGDCLNRATFYSYPYCDFVIVTGALSQICTIGWFVWTVLVLLSPPRRICNRHCFSVCLSVSNFVQKLLTDLHEIFREGWQWASEQMIKFWWRSRSQIPIWITALVRRALVEVCTVPVLLVMGCIFMPFVV